MKKLRIRLTVIPSAIAFFGLLCASDLQNTLSAFYCVAIFFFVSMAHLLDLYALKDNTKVTFAVINTAIFVLAFILHNWLLCVLTLLIINYIALITIIKYKNN